MPAHELACYTKRFVCYFRGQGHLRTGIEIWLNFFFFLFATEHRWYIVMSQGVLWKDWVDVFKVIIAVKVQSFVQYWSILYFLTAYALHISQVLYHLSVPLLPRCPKTKQSHYTFLTHVFIPFTWQVTSSFLAAILPRHTSSVKVNFLSICLLISLSFSVEIHAVILLFVMDFVYLVPEVQSFVECLPFIDFQCPWYLSS